MEQPRRESWKIFYIEVVAQYLRPAAKTYPTWAIVVITLLSHIYIFLIYNAMSVAATIGAPCHWFDLGTDTEMNDGSNFLKIKITPEQSMCF